MGIMPGRKSRWIASSNNIRVSTLVGFTQLTRMPCGPTSLASAHLEAPGRADVEDSMKGMHALHRG